MRITIVICTDTLGDDNTESDNQRYVGAVVAAIQEAHMSAIVDVSLSDNPCDAGCYVSKSPQRHNYDVADEVLEIAHRVWDRADY